MTRMSSNLRRRRGSRVTRANSLKNSFLTKSVLKFLDTFLLYFFLSAGPRGPNNTTTSTYSTILKKYVLHEFDLNGEKVNYHYFSGSPTLNTTTN